MRTRSRPFWILLSAGAASAALIATALALAISQPPSSSRAAGPVTPARLVRVRSFGANPTGLGMYLYVPNSLRPDPAILVAAHGCTESGPYFYETTGFSTLADEYGFIVIYPSSSEPDGCRSAATSRAPPSRRR